jgi:hypothetical protein
MGTHRIYEEEEKVGSEIRETTQFQDFFLKTNFQDSHSFLVIKISKCVIFTSFTFITLLMAEIPLTEKNFGYLIHQMVGQDR